MLTVVHCPYAQQSTIKSTILILPASGSSSLEPSLMWFRAFGQLVPDSSFMVYVVKQLGNPSWGKD